MKIICSQKKLSEAISTVQKAISPRSTLPVLEGIYIESLKDVIKLIGTDLDLGIECYIEAEVLSKGSIVVPSRIFGDIIRKFPDSDVKITLLDNFRVKIECQNSVITLQGLNPEEYPELQRIEENNPIEIEQDLFRDMVRQTVFSVATEETRPIYTGALMELDGSSVSLACLDGYRLALRREPIEGNQNRNKVVIPGKSLNEISKIMGGEERKVSITIGEKHVLFDLGYTRIISRLLEGDFINYRQIIPQEYQTRVKIDTSILSESIERASLLAKEGSNNLIKLSISEDKMTITSNSELGQAYEEVPLILEGKEIDIAFNARYFLDILKAIDDQEVCLDFTTNISPCVVRPLEGNHYTYLLLPVRTNN